MCACWNQVHYFHSYITVPWCSEVSESFLYLALFIVDIIWFAVPTHQSELSLGQSSTITAKRKQYKIKNSTNQRSQQIKNKQRLKKAHAARDKKYQDAKKAAKTGTQSVPAQVFDIQKHLGTYA